MQSLEGRFHLDRQKYFGRAEFGYADREEDSYSVVIAYQTGRPADRLHVDVEKFEQGDIEGPRAQQQHPQCVFWIELMSDLGLIVG
jgi:hypothetical protein